MSKNNLTTKTQRNEGETKERPILFSGEMIRAIIEGRKTQTRRVIKLRDFRPCYNVPGSDWYFRSKNGIWSDVSTSRLIERYCPYGKPGDRLWVRETWQALVPTSILPIPNKFMKTQPMVSVMAYKATERLRFERSGGELFEGPWRPSIFMPRWASRILLEKTDTRVERLTDISKEDAKKKGAIPNTKYQSNFVPGQEYRFAFRDTWETINGSGSWMINPWVWVIEFKVLEVRGG